MASTTSFLCRWTLQTLFQLRFFLPSSTFLISDRRCRVFPKCSFQYDRTCMPGCQAMLFGFSQSVEVEDPFKSGHHLLLITGLWPHTASRLCCQRPQTVSLTGYFNNIILDLVRSTFMAQRPRTTFSSPSLTTVSLYRFQA